MDIGIELLANPSKIRKKTYQLEKKSDDFNLKEFIFENTKTKACYIKKKGK